MLNPSLKAKLDKLSEDIMCYEDKLFTHYDIPRTILNMPMATRKVLTDKTYSKPHSSTFSVNNLTEPVARYLSRYCAY